MIVVVSYLISVIKQAGYISIKKSIISIHKCTVEVTNILKSTDIIMFIETLTDIMCMLVKIVFICSEILFEN